MILENMDLKREPKAARDEVLAARARAPIAGQFEDCMQDFEKLTSALEACRRGLEEWFTKKVPATARPRLKETLNSLDEAVTKFKTWDRDLSASNRVLDHALRGCSRMSTTTVGLLEELDEALVKGKCFKLTVILHC